MAFTVASFDAGIAKPRSKSFDRALSLMAAFTVVAIVMVARYWSRGLNRGATRGSRRYCRDASQRPLQAIPPEAPFHLPDPPLPLSWPLA
jgi:hypothetical protein